MIIVGYVNKGDNVNICIEGEHSEYDLKDAKESAGIKAESVYVYDLNLKPDDIGKNIIAYRRMSKAGKLYCSGVKIS